MSLSNRLSKVHDDQLSFDSEKARIEREKEVERLARKFGLELEEAIKLLEEIEADGRLGTS